ncbi:MAG: RNA-binding transcriptional accessory protein [candidate division Zixibacteria bacterium]|nr:RNA-binding transcriptional accessory protein [candidate division Zixibacteria bacterium]
MNQDLYSKKIAAELKIQPQQVESTAILFKEGATIPFIARYRKEVTGSLDEVAIQAIRDRLEVLEKLDKRREAILESLKERDLLEEELEKKIRAAETITELEDLYLPYRPKKRTRATIAKEKGLEPLAEIIFEQKDEPVDASSYVDPEKGVKNIHEAIDGAQDIIAEWVSEDADLRSSLRKLFEKDALLESKLIKKKEAEAVKFRDYFEWSEMLDKTPSHRIHAMLRGQKEGFLIVHALPDEAKSLSIVESYFVHGDNDSSELVKQASHDSYKRLIAPSLETELINAVREAADTEAIAVFTSNLRELLLSAPLGQKTVLAIDPGFRTGCKVVALDAQGKFLGNATIYPSKGVVQQDQAASIIEKMCEQHKIEIIAVGNGTASRETESFLKELNLGIPIVMVDESGASVYSASAVARDEFPDFDVTVRGSISIGRRLQDPLAELVKIDPKSIGVGQYQHDVDQTALKKGLDDTVISCVNAVGVELNTASVQLLTYVAGLGPQLAKNIIKQREDNGPFKTREELLEVPRLGSKAFEQAAGFLRIFNGDNLLDASAVHPERYDLVEQMAKDLSCKISDLIFKEEFRQKIDLKKYVSDDVGMPTLLDIITELDKPGRDPRPEFEPFSFSEEVHAIEDLHVGMTLPGIVTNVTSFGAFVDIGVHQDGLVHLSQITDGYVKDPSEYLKVRQKVKVTVLDIDLERKRIALTMRAGVLPEKRKEDN